jgi:ribonuclease HI
MNEINKTIMVHIADTMNTLSNDIENFLLHSNGTDLKEKSIIFMGISNLINHHKKQLQAKFEIRSEKKISSPKSNEELISATSDHYESLLKTLTNDLPTSDKAISRIYTDGSCLGNPGPGGSAFCILDDKGEMLFSYSSSQKLSTNNRAELVAAIQAVSYLLKSPPKEDGTIIVCDSKYVIDNLLNNLPKWKKNSWRNAKNKIVENYDLWRCLDHLTENVGTHTLTWEWVKAHHVDPWNDYVDQLAKEAAKSVSFPF